MVIRNRAVKIKLYSKILIYKYSSKVIYNIILIIINIHKKIKFRYCLDLRGINNMRTKIIPFVLTLLLITTSVFMAEAHLSELSKEHMMKPSPLLQINPTSYDFGNMFIGDRDDTTFEIWNGACCYLVYSITANCTWITVDPTSGGSSGEHDIITVNIDTSVLDAGFHQCDIQITTTNAGGAIFHVYVNTSIADTPRIACYPSACNFGDVIQSTAASTNFEIWNCGIDVLSYSLSETYDWVLVSPMSGTSTGEHDTITITLTTSSLSSGPHSGAIQITSNGGNKGFSFSINIKNPVPELAYSPQSHNFGSKEIREIDHTSFRIWNAGIGTLSYTITENCNWITVDRTGDNVGDEPDLIIVTIDTTNITQKYNKYDLFIDSNGGSGNFTVTVYVGVVYTNITVGQVYSLLTSTSNGIQIPIDVRYDSEWAAEHIDTPAPENPRHHCVCAMSADETVLQAFIELYQGKEIILYCLAGSRSLTAANLLVEHNFNGTIYIMIGGITAWKEAGYPTKPNMPPNIPVITGEARGKIGEEYHYTFTTTDVDSDDVYYYVNWSDNTTNQLIGPFHSGEEVTLNHIWSKKGTYTVKVKARDIYGSESDYATLEIKMPKTSSTVFHQLLLRIFEKIHVFFLF
jgi:rhodanese-related sulfurtransferase